MQKGFSGDHARTIPIVEVTMNFTGKDVNTQSNGVIVCWKQKFKGEAHLVTIQVQGRLYTRPVLAHVTDGCTENIPTSLSIESASQNPQSRVEATGKKNSYPSSSNWCIIA